MNRRTKNCYCVAVLWGAAMGADAQELRVTLDRDVYAPEAEATIRINLPADWKVRLPTDPRRTRTRYVACISGPLEPGIPTEPFGPLPDAFCNMKQQRRVDDARPEHAEDLAKDPKATHTYGNKLKLPKDPRPAEDTGSAEIWIVARLSYQTKPDPAPSEVIFGKTRLLFKCEKSGPAAPETCAYYAS